LTHAARALNPLHDTSGWNPIKTVFYSTQTTKRNHQYLEETKMSDYKYKPVLYYAITFLITFALWFAGAYASFLDNQDGLYMLLMLPGLMAPFLISLVPLLVGIMPLVVLVSIALSLPFGGSVAQFQLAEGFSFSSGFVPVLLLLLLAAGFEELGWRGYAFDSLQSRFSYLKAAIIFSVLWSVWHFPLMFVKDSYQYEIFNQNIWYAVNFFVGIIPMGVIISWMCIKNRKSVLAAILFHFVINLSQEVLNMTQTTKCIETVVLTVVAVAVVFVDKDLFFAREAPVAELDA
jgi:membrane protease YdiL (CAAX protease family)